MCAQYESVPVHFIFYQSTSTLKSNLQNGSPASDIGFLKTVTVSLKRLSYIHLIGLRVSQVAFESFTSR